MKLIAKSTYKTMPWKNAGGETSEIDRFPEGEGSFVWRLSQANIQSNGPFSIFKGCDRWLCVFKGAAILLDDKKIELDEPVQFSGDQQLECRLTNGPVSDLGLIFDRDKVKAKMQIVEGALHFENADVHYFFDLQTGDTMKIETESKITVPKSIWISVTRI